MWGIQHTVLWLGAFTPWLGPVPLPATHRLLELDSRYGVARCRPATPTERLRIDAIEPVPTSAAPAPAARRGTGLEIRLIPSPAVQAEPMFLAAMERAADAWRMRLENDVQIDIAIDFVRDEPFIAATTSTRYAWPYAALRSAMVANASPAESWYLSALPGVMRFQTPGGVVSTVAWPNVAIRDGLYQALGGDPLDTDGVPDTRVVFNLDVPYDTTPEDGIEPGRFDPALIMAHEIGHALGFSSTVDTTQSSFPSPLDTLRMGALDAANDPSTRTDLARMPRERRPDVEAALDPVDALAGFTSPMRFSTGATQGDGFTAGHWKDDALLGGDPPVGLMDPTPLPGVAFDSVLPKNDLLALSLIGWSIPVLIPTACGPADVTTDGSDSGLPDGRVTMSDFSLYLSRWDAGDPLADITADGGCAPATGGDGVTLSDLSCFLSLWSEGCAESAADGG
ncbi:MAG: NF038122 family metalloprotease [Planctomycetota bacterium]